MAELQKYNPETANFSPKAVVATIESGAELGVGLSEGTVRRVRVEVSHDGITKAISMAEKHFDVTASKSDRESTVQRILQNHALLRAKGLPTFPTLRIDPVNTDFLYMTDLTRNGKDAVYSIPDWKRGENRVGKLEGNEEKIAISNSEELSAQLANLYKKVVDEGCVINLADAFFLVIDKQDRKAKIMLGDILEIDFVQNVSEDVVEKNYMSFSIFIDEINTHLSKESRLRKRPTAGEYHQLLRQVRSST